jgi:hypothetical protein
MPNAFTYLWTGAEVKLHARTGHKPLTHAASNMFFERRVRLGDFLYIWAFVSGKLLLIGRLQVTAIGTYEQIKPLLKNPTPTSKYSDHIHSNVGTPKRFDLEVPKDQIPQLRFISPNGDINPPRTTRAGSPDPQTFRGVRRITPETQQLLDRLLAKI